MTTEPYTIKNGVKLVDLLGVVCRLQSTEGTSAAHFPALMLSRAWASSPSLVRMWGFRPCSIRPLARSTYPVVCRWETVAQSTWMLLSSQKYRIFSPVNWVPLSVMMELGTPK
jgi:hypothetical protein